MRRVGGCCHRGFCHRGICSGLLRYRLLCGFMLWLLNLPSKLLQGHCIVFVGLIRMLWPW